MKSTRLQMTRAEFLKGAISSLGLGACGAGRLFAVPAGWTPGRTPNLVFGAMSDSHLRTGPQGDYIGLGFSDKYLAAALKWYRDENVDAVVHTGDMAHRGLDAEMGFHSRRWFEIFPDDKAPDGHKVARLFTLGNHDIEGGTYGDFAALRYPDPEERRKHLLATDVAGFWERYWHEPYRPVWHKRVKGYNFIGRHYGVPESESVKLMEKFADRLGLGVGAKPVFHLQHVCPGRVLNGALRRWRNTIGFYGHSHGSASNWNQIRLLDDANPCIQIPAIDPRGSNGLGGDSYVFKVKPEGHDLTGRSHQAYLVRVYDDMMLVTRRDFGDDGSGSLGADWALTFGKYDPHSFSRGELKKQIGCPQFAEGAKLQVRGLFSGVKLSIPRADGNPDTRVYAYDVVATGDGGKEHLHKCVYTAGCNLAMGHEPMNGVTPLVLKRDSLPAKGAIRFTVTPMTSLGTSGRPLTADLDLA